jgi:alkylation response protein AidB-like acyl-CoA dehydrogenase
MRIATERRVELSAVDRHRVIATWIEAEVVRLTNIRTSQLRRTHAGIDGSIGKLRFAELNQEIFNLCIDLLGPHGLIDYDYSMREQEPMGLIGRPGSARTMFLRSRANSIEGGTSEIQRNLIGERVLGLPREPQPDKDRHK